MKRFIENDKVDGDVLKVEDADGKLSLEERTSPTAVCVKDLEALAAGQQQQDPSKTILYPVTRPNSQDDTEDARSNKKAYNTLFGKHTGTMNPEQIRDFGKMTTVDARCASKWPLHFSGQGPN